MPRSLERAGTPGQGARPPPHRVLGPSLGLHPQRVLEQQLARRLEVARERAVGHLRVEPRGGGVVEPAHARAGGAAARRAAARARPARARPRPRPRCATARPRCGARSGRRSSRATRSPTAPRSSATPPWPPASAPPRRPRGRCTRGSSRPESGPGSSASCGVSPVTSGSSSALTRAATSEADCAIAPRSESSASVRTPAWKLPLGSATPSRGSSSAFSPATLSSISSTAARRSSASSSVPSTCGTQRNTNASWIARPAARSRGASAPSSSRSRRATSTWPVVRARGVHARVEHGEVGARRLVGERGDAERGVEQPRRVVEDERGLADADGVRAHEARCRRAGRSGPARGRARRAPRRRARRRRRPSTRPRRRAPCRSRRARSGRRCRASRARARTA